MIQCDRNGVTHERDHVHAHDAELLFQRWECREETVIVQFDRNGVIRVLARVLARDAALLRQPTRNSNNAKVSLRRC